MTSLEPCVDISINTCCLCHVFSVNIHVVRESSPVLCYLGSSPPHLGAGEGNFQVDIRL